MYTKAKIFNLALNALLLQRQVVEPETDKSNENKVLLGNWDVAFRATLEDLDLDSTSTQADLELHVQDPNSKWKYGYKYPSKCAFFRRIVSCELVDCRDTRIPLRIAIHNGRKIIMTNEEDAIGEFITHDVPLESLSATVGLCIAYRLAVMSSPLITGKGAKTLIEQIEQKYVTAKAEAQEQDQRENFNYDDPTVTSEFVRTRTS